MARKILYVIITLLVFHSSFAKDNYLIGFSQCSQGDWRANMEDEMQRELMFHDDLKLVIKQSGDSSKLQIKQINELIKLGIDLLIIAPNELSSVQPVIEKVYKSGIPVVLIDRMIDSDQYSAYVGGNNFEIGQTAGIYLANMLNNKGNVIELLGSLNSSPAIERMKGFKDALNDLPDLQIVDKIHTRWNHQAVLDSLAKRLQNNPNINAIFAHADFLAAAAGQVLLDQFPNRNIKVIGVDGLPNANGGIQMVEEGIITSTLIYPTGGKAAIQAASKILRGVKYEKINLLPTTLVDKTNVKIIRLQYANIASLQEDINKSKDMLDVLGGRYKRQQLLLIITVLSLLLVIILIGMLFRAFKNKKQANLNLEKQKSAISEQNLQLKQMSEELEEVTQERLRFYTNISHEFRTPLTLITGPIETLQSHKNTTEEQLELLDLARQNVSILLRLVDQIIDFRKYEVGKHSFNPIRTDLKKQLEEWNKLFSEVSKRKQIHFNFETDSKSKFDIDFDIEKMERIYFNLLSNAFKFTPEKGIITVSLQKQTIDNKVRAELKVSNSGKELSKSAINNIFNRFYQVDTKSGGSGIGLALVKAFVYIHNGEINVSNEDGYVTFTLYFPFDQLVATEIIEPTLNKGEMEKSKSDFIGQVSEPEDSYSFDDHFDDNKTTILLVDDHPGIRSYLKSVLKTNYAIIEAHDGVDGIRKAIKYIPDLIISDVMMPGVDGVELCQHLKTEPLTSHIPIVLLTACALDEQRILGLESGADDYISKPININVLEVRVRKLIETRMKLKELFGKNILKSGQKQSLDNIDKTFMDKLQEKIESKISDSNLNIEELGKDMGLSRSQFYRKVKALTNYPPIEFLKIVRLKKAVYLMTITDSNVSQISFDTGFSSPSYFTKCFKKYYGQSPSDYAQEIRNT